MKHDDAVRSLAALAQSARLSAYRALVAAGPAGMTAGALAQALGVPPSTLSFHLKELMQAGLLLQQRDGRHLVYRACFERMGALLSYLTEHCCEGAPCAASAVPACATTC